MKFGEEHLCENCGARYAVSYSRLPARDSDCANCEVCRHEMAKWNDTFVPSFKLQRDGSKEG